MRSRTSRASRKQGRSPIPSPEHSLFAGSRAVEQQLLLVPHLFWRTRTCSKSTPTRRSLPATSAHKSCEATLGRGSSASSVGKVPRYPYFCTPCQKSYFRMNVHPDCQEKVNKIIVQTSPALDKRFFCPYFHLSHEANTKIRGEEVFSFVHIVWQM